MSKRRSSVIGKRGAGKHQPEHVPNERPAGEVKPIISKTKHGKPVKYDLHEETFMPDFAGARRAATAFLLFAGLVAVLCVITCCSAVALETF